jgi:hypothetical protein
MLIDTTVTSWRSITANWTVPDGPVSTYASDGSQTYFNFPGLQNYTGILQPVLAYGYVGHNGWQIGAWYCHEPTGCPHSPLQNVNPGDLLYGSVTGSSCSGGSCSWSVFIVDSTTMAATGDIWMSPDNANLAVGGAIETYELSNNCNYYPTQALKFHNISLSNRSGTVSQSWSTVNGTTNAGCARTEVNGSTSVAIMQHVVSGYMIGSLSVNTGNTCTYSAVASGGWGGPYTYSWTVDGTILSGQGTDQITASFTDGNHSVAVEETDSQGVVGGINITVFSQTSGEFTCEHT